MKKVLTFCEFCDEFRGTQYENNFSYEGKEALYNYLTDLEEETGTDYNCDIVSLCCDFTEFDDFEDLKAQYNNIKTMEDLEDNTQVIYIPDTTRFIIQNY